MRPVEMGTSTLQMVSLVAALAVALPAVLAKDVDVKLLHASSCCKGKCVFDCKDMKMVRMNRKQYGINAALEVTEKMASPLTAKFEILQCANEADTKCVVKFSFDDPDACPRLKEEDSAYSPIFASIEKCSASFTRTCPILPDSYCMANCTMDPEKLMEQFPMIKDGYYRARVTLLNMFKKMLACFEIFFKIFDTQEDE